MCVSMGLSVLHQLDSHLPTLYKFARVTFAACACGSPKVHACPANEVPDEHGQVAVGLAR